MNRQVLSVCETAQALGLGRSTVYRAIRLGRIPAARLCGRLLVPTAFVDSISHTADSWSGMTSQGRSVCAPSPPEEQPGG